MRGCSNCPPGAGFPEILWAWLGAGAAILLLVALLVNNLSRNRKYPEYWI